MKMKVGSTSKCKRQEKDDIFDVQIRLVYCIRSKLYLYYNLYIQHILLMILNFYMYIYLYLNNNLFK